MNLICCCWRMAPNTRVTRKWEVFAGRNKFFCDGYLMTAPHSGVFYLTVFLITGTSALFFAFDCPFLAEKITPAIPIVGGLLYLFTMSSLFRTSFTDPGIIPRASHDEAAYIEKQIEVPNSLNSPTYRPPPRTKEVLVKGQTVKLKYCFTCKIFRPPRASHCSLCDNCVDRFDHHCPWVGNCVGKRNYRFFYMFIVSLAFLTVFIFTCSTTHIVLLAKDKNDVTLDAIKEAPFSLIIAIICFLSVWSVIGLAGFHTYLTTSDQTTNEDIKGSFSAKGGPQATNPYSKGNICSNCFHILCGPMTPSLIDRRGVVTDEYRIQMQSGEATKYNVLPTQTAGPPMVVNQPTLGSLENGTNTYNVNNENGTTNPGIYRQQSFENNLNSGNSTSVSHLIENEIPLAQMNGTEVRMMNSSVQNLKNSPVDENSLSLFKGSPNLDNVDGIEEAELNDNDLDFESGAAENQILGKNLSGSYSNLYPDEIGNAPNSSSLRTSVSGIGDQIVNSEEILLKSNEENYYSNLPQGLSLIEKESSEKHVYSNVLESQDLENSFGSSSLNTTITSNSNENPLCSTMIGDDLDLDDPIIVAKAFDENKGNKNGNLNSLNGNKKSAKKKQKPQPKLATPNDGHLEKLSSDSSTSSSSRQPLNQTNKRTKPHKKNVIPTVAIIETKNNTNNAQNSPPELEVQSPQKDNSGFVLNSSRMQLLHDTTMIDTALDLDSLDTVLTNNGPNGAAIV